MELFIVIGYHEDSGEAIDGTVFQADSSSAAIRKSLAWVAHDSHEDVGGWRCFKYVPEWGPGHEIKPTTEDYR